MNPVESADVEFVIRFDRAAFDASPLPAEEKRAALQAELAGAVRALTGDLVIDGQS